MSDGYMEIGTSEGPSFVNTILYSALVFTVGYFFGKAVAQAECDDHYERENESPHVRRVRRHNHNLTSSSSTVCVIL